MNRRIRKKRLAMQATQAWPQPLSARKDAEAPQEALLDMLEHGAVQLQRLERLLAKSKDPGMEMLVHLHRRIVLGLSARTDDPKVMLQLAGSTMKLLLAWARIEEKRKDRDLAERKFQDKQAARGRDETGAKSGIKPETQDHIQGILHLL
jgi:hypothetical protein